MRDIYLPVLKESLLTAYCFPISSLSTLIRVSLLFEILCGHLSIK